MVLVPVHQRTVDADVRTVRHDGYRCALLLVDSEQGEVHPITAMEGHRASDAGCYLDQTETPVLGLSRLEEPRPSQRQHGPDALRQGHDARVRHGATVHPYPIAHPDSKSWRTIQQPLVSIREAIYGVLPPRQVLRDDHLLARVQSLLEFGERSDDASCSGPCPTVWFHEYGELEVVEGRRVGHGHSHGPAESVVRFAASNARSQPSPALGLSASRPARRAAARAPTER